MTDQKAINQMKNFANAFNDIENGKIPKSNPNHESGDDPSSSIKVMENILGKLSAIDAFDNVSTYDALAQNAHVIKPTYMDAESKLANIYANPELYQDSYIEGEVPKDHVPEPHYVYESAPVGQTNSGHVSKPKTPWSIVSEDVDGLKNVKKYSIQNAYNKQTIIDGIMMQEAAMALLNILNEGGTLTNPKVLGIISYGIQYTSILEQAIKSLKDRQAVLRESNYSRAAELDVLISDQKKKAQNLKEQINSFITANGFNSK